MINLEHIVTAYVNKTALVDWKELCNSVLKLQTDDQIKEFCKTNYNVNFDIASKTEVNGDNAHPLWTYLRLVANNKNDISWNFEKFLIDKQGNITPVFTDNPGF